MTTPSPATGPFPPPPPSAGAPGSPAPSARRPWRDRLPEIVAGVGTALVVAAMLGFLSSTWTALGEYGKALVLGGAAVGLTAAALWADQAPRRATTSLVPLVWLSGTAALVSAIALAAIEAMPDAARVAVALGGLSGVVHVAALWLRRPDSALAQLAGVAAAVFAAGPVGTSLADTYRSADLGELLVPLGAALDPTLGSDVFWIVAIGHLAIGIAWLSLLTQVTGRPAHVARLGGSALVAYAALEFNALATPLGATIALLIVLGHLIAGIASDDAGLLVIGAIGVLFSSVRVLFALFDGEVAVTVTVLGAGLAMLAWAFRAANARRSETAGKESMT